MRSNVVKFIQNLVYFTAWVSSAKISKMSFSLQYRREASIGNVLKIAFHFNVLEILIIFRFSSSIETSLGRRISKIQISTLFYVLNSSMYCNVFWKSDNSFYWAITMCSQEWLKTVLCKIVSTKDKGQFAYNFGLANL